jgi:RND family efflux transporter MFP subunit
MNRTRPLSLTIASGAALLLAAMIATGCNGDSAEEGNEVARPAKLFTVHTSGESAARVFPGQVQAAKRVPLAFRVGGPVVGVAVSKGQRVAQGDLLANVDPRDYEVQVKNLEAKLAEKRAQLDQVTEEYQRVRGLYQHDNASKSDFDRARAAVDVGKAQVESTEASLRASRLALFDTALEAPFDGVVADRLVDTHQVVSAGQPVLLFQDMRGMEVVIAVPEREVTALTRTAPEAIVVRFDALPTEEFPAAVKEFATETDRQTQTFPVTWQSERPPATDLLPGMTASVSWFTANGNGQHHSMVVPLASIVTDESGETYVWRLDSASMRISRVRVVTGALTDEGLEIHSGLEAGTRILAAGVNFVSDGQLVRPISE